MTYCSTCGGITRETCPLIVEYADVAPKICTCMSVEQAAAYTEGLSKLYELVSFPGTHPLVELYRKRNAT